MMEMLLSPLQLDATSGVGKTLIAPEPERIVRFLIRSKGPPTGGEIQIECCPMSKGATQTTVWRPDGGAISVPTDIGVAAAHYAGKVSGMFRARISTPITGGTITVWPCVGYEQALAAGKKHHDTRRHLFLNFLRESFNVDPVEVELRAHYSQLP